MRYGYDLIGDVHGCSATLKYLLEELGYRKVHGRYQHTSRQALFLGDLIDSGPGQAEVVEIVRCMCEHEAAYCIMGNHEFNAIAYYTPHRQGGYLRSRTDNRRRQHAAFLREHESDPALWAETIAWFKTLPLWLDLDYFRVIHACWDPGSFAVLTGYSDQGRLLSDGLLMDASRKDHNSFQAVETLLKGKEIVLPEGHAFTDKYGIERSNIRVRWWDSSADTYSKAFMGPADWQANMPHDSIDRAIFCPYHQDDKPVFFGHYWRSGHPEPLAANVACLDYSVARPSGQLVAYRWSGERQLEKSHFFAVARVDGPNPE